MDFDPRDDDEIQQVRSDIAHLRSWNQHGMGIGREQRQIDQRLERLGLPPMNWDVFWDETAQARAARSVLTKTDLRADVWSKTGGKCWYCGIQTTPWRDFAIDHYLPRVAGGTDDLENLVPACRACNTRKGGRPLDRFRQIMSNTAGTSFSAEQRAYLEAHGITLPNIPGDYQFYFEKLTGGQS